MKKMIFLIIAMLITTPFCYASSSPSIIFCEKFDELWNPINTGNKFSGKTISWIAKIGKPIGIQQITVTLYKHEGIEEKLISRNNIDVNPKWDTIGTRNMNFPSDGEFTVSITTPNGNSIISGKVDIINYKLDEKPKQQETMGGVLEQLFKRYSPKK